MSSVNNSSKVLRLAAETVDYTLLTAIHFWVGIFAGMYIDRHVFSPAPRTKTERCLRMVALEVFLQVLVLFLTHTFITVVLRHLYNPIWNRMGISTRNDMIMNLPAGFALGVSMTWFSGNLIEKLNLLVD